MADATAMAVLWASHADLAFKVIPPAVQLVGLAWIVGRHVGRQHEFRRLIPRIQDLEREVDRLQGRLDDQEPQRLLSERHHHGGVRAAAPTYAGSPAGRQMGRRLAE